MLPTAAFLTARLIFAGVFLPSAIHGPGRTLVRKREAHSV
jgi:hypothetical protein